MVSTQGTRVMKEDRLTTPLKLLQKHPRHFTKILGHHCLVLGRRHWKYRELPHLMEGLCPFPAFLVRRG